MCGAGGVSIYAQGIHSIHKYTEYIIITLHYIILHHRVIERTKKTRPLSASVFVSLVCSLAAGAWLCIEPETSRKDSNVAETLVGPIRPFLAETFPSFLVMRPPRLGCGWGSMGKLTDQRGQKQISQHSATEIHHRKSLRILLGVLIQEGAEGQDQWLPEHDFAFRAVNPCVYFLPRYGPGLHNQRKLFANALAQSFRTDSQSSPVVFILFAKTCN